MTTFIQVSDPAIPAMPPWWMVLIPRGDHEALLHLHELFSRQFWILDGRDPHNERDRERGEKEGILTMAHLRHPTILSAHWFTTAIHLFSRGDILVASRGGMRPRDKTLIEHATIDSKDWPPAFSNDRLITVTTWGNHWYLVCREIAFVEKYPTEQAAMDVAKRFAPVANIAVKREARDYREGD